jgi:hypothetical protein
MYNADAADVAELFDLYSKWCQIRRACGVVNLCDVADMLLCCCPPSATRMQFL